MAFVTIGFSKSGTSRRTTEGARAMRAPVTGLTEIPVTLPACRGCVSKSLHGNPCSAIGWQVPHGEHRFQRIPAGNKLDVESTNEVQTALYLAGFVFNGFIGDDVIYNVGIGGNNASQFVTYEIVSASDDVLTLRGPNPKRLAVGGTRENPNWPLEAPIELKPPSYTTEQWNAVKYARLIPTLDAFALPIGSVVEFEPPSVLASRIVPIITAIDLPASDDLDDVEFDVTTTGGHANARKPYNRAFPPADGKYYCKVRAELLAPQTWANPQAPRETAFTRRMVEHTTNTVLSLLNSDGGTARVLFPDMADNALVVHLVRADDGSREAQSVSWILARLATTEPTSSTWASTLDLSGAGIGTTYSKAVVWFHPEAVASDTYRVQWQSSCSNSQIDPSGSYVHDGIRRCTKVSSSGFPTYRAECWKPGGACDQFTLSPADTRAQSADFWSSLWTRASWILNQGMPGISSARNFSLVRPANAGPSIASICGSWNDEVPVGFFATRFEFFGATLGKRITWTDDGNAYQTIVCGATNLRPYDLSSDGGPSYTWNAGDVPETGTIAELVTGWTTKTDATGGAMDESLALFPWRDTGATNVYSYEHGNAGGAFANELHSNSEAFITGVVLAGEDENISADIRARFE